MTLDDGQLMRAYANGDTAAFEQLYARHGDELFRFVSSSCSHAAEAPELYQDIWMNVIRSRHSYRADAPFNAWLYRIARNRLIDHYRARRLPTTELDPDSGSDSACMPAAFGPEDISSLSQRANLLDKALQSLPSAQREALLLRHIAGMSLLEIAGVTQAGVETIKSRLRYGTGRLRALLQELS